MKAAHLVLLVALVGGVALAAGQIETYPDYFEDNPKVKVHTIDSLSHQEQILFWKNLIDLEDGKDIVVSIPKELGKGYFVNYTEAEISEIVVAKYAHAIWLDKNEIVPWKLESYSDGELEILFNRSSVFEILDSGYSYMMGEAMVSDYSPSELFSINKQFIKENSNETIIALLENYRNDFRHGISGEPLKDKSQGLHSILADKDSHDHRVSYSGCQSMARIIEASLRNLNIPAKQEYGKYAGGGHSSVSLPTINALLLHADDIYNAGKKEMPFEDVLIDVDLHGNLIRNCDERDFACIDNALFNWEVHNEIKYAFETKYHIQSCCRRDFGYGSCKEYVDSGFSYSQYLTKKEKDSLITGLMAAC